jgi:hypothetical protein
MLIIYSQTLSSGGPYTITSQLSSGYFVPMVVSLLKMNDFTNTNFKNGGLNEWVQFAIALLFSSSDTFILSEVFTSADSFFAGSHDTAMTSSLTSLGANTTLYLCSDSSGSNTFGCDIKNFKVVYGYFGYPFPLVELSRIFFSLFKILKFILATLLGYYKMYEGTGYTLSNSQGTLGQAYLGTNSFESSYKDFSRKLSRLPKYCDFSNMDPQCNIILFIF